MILWELCKMFKFDHTNKWYIHNPESVLENEIHKIFWDIEIQTEHLISAWQPDLVITNNKKKKKEKKGKLKESEKREKYLDFAR